MDRLNKEQQEAVVLAIGGHNVCITGSAGTGKSHVLKTIVAELRSRKKRFQITSSTGIAGTQFENCMTVHSYAGILDGRYRLEVHAERMERRNMACMNAIQRIQDTDVLIITEVGMLSERTFKLLEISCRLSKKSTMVFGGLQLIVEGDFKQLSPIAKSHHGDLGRYCFAAGVWSIIAHTIKLQAVVRQSDVNFVKAIAEISAGSPSQSTCQFMATLARPLPGHLEKDAVILMSRNEQIAIRNLRMLDEDPKCSGPIHWFSAIDEGNKKFLRGMIARAELALRVGCRVMLVKNLSTDNGLINGSRGKVTAIHDQKVTVLFDHGIAKVLSRHRFDEYDQRTSGIEAIRHQIPLVLAYALTIHKCQGMTLDSAIIHCRYVDQPGMLGVAVGRVKTPNGVQVIDFSPDKCPPHPPEVLQFGENKGHAVDSSMKCCQPKVFITTDNTSDNCIEDLLTEAGVSETGSTIIDDELTAEEEKHLAAILEEYELSEAEEQFGVVTARLREQIMSLTFVANIESVSPAKMTEFIGRVWGHLLGMVQVTIGEVKSTGKEQARLTLHTQKVIRYIQSESLSKLVDGAFEPGRQNPMNRNMLIRVVRSIHDHALDNHCATHVSYPEATHSETVPVTAYGKIRYLAGRALFATMKERQSQSKSLKASMRKGKLHSHEFAGDAMFFLKSTVAELQQSSKYPESLEYSIGHEYADGQLQHVTDALFEYCLKIEGIRRLIQTEKNMTIHRDTLPQFVEGFTLGSEDLEDAWTSRVDPSQVSSDVALSNFEKTNIMSGIRQSLTSHYLRVGHNGFRKEIVEKHRSSKTHKKGAIRDELRGKMGDKTPKNRAGSSGKMGEKTPKNQAGSSKEIRVRKGETPQGSGMPAVKRGRKLKDLA